MEKFRVIIYESSSFGGCYEYSKSLFKAFNEHCDVEDTSLILPKNSDFSSPGVFQFLMNDRKKVPSKILNKLYFLIRQFINPFLLFYYLLRKEKSFVIFNDFEQITAFFWVPFFRLLKKKHQFAVFLHDPDRDQYPPNFKFSNFSMKKIMTCMDVALYHEYLPDKEYYKDKLNTKYISVPHGIYHLCGCDEKLFQSLTYEKGNEKFISIVGNLRQEKNYEIAIQSLSKIPKTKLLIAGNPANSNFELQKLKDLANQYQVENRIIWIIKYLSEEELASVIKVSDIILLNYSKSFSSQSGILNVIAPYKKYIVYSRTESALFKICAKYNLGFCCEPDSLESFIKSTLAAVENPISIDDKWEDYLYHCSWNRNIEITLSSLKTPNNS